MMERNDYPTPGDFRDQAVDLTDLDDGEVEQYARACKVYAANLWDDLLNIYEAIESVHYDFEELGEAGKLWEQAKAYTDLSNSMSDLISWHPKHSIDTGKIENGEG